MRTWVHRRGLILLALCGLLLAPHLPAQTSHPQQTAPTPSTDYTQGQQALAAQQWRLAEQRFARAAAADALQSKPAHTDALFLQAQCLIHLSEYPQAGTALRLYLQQEPRSAQALYLLGLVLHRQNQPKASLELFTQAAAITAPSSENLRTVALNYVLLNDYADAIHWLQRAVQMDKANAEAWYDLARAHMHDGNFNAATGELQQSLSLAPHNAKALDNLGICLEAQNRQDDAIHAYENAVTEADGMQHPTEQPFLNLATLLNTRNDFGKAAVLLKRAAIIAPQNSRVFEELARAHLGSGQIAPAQAAMERAIALDPKNSRLHFQLARIYRTAGLPAKAQAEFQLSSSLYGQHSAE